MELGFELGVDLGPTSLSVERIGNIAIIGRRDDKVGFHVRNLEVAELSKEAWDQPIRDSDVLGALEEWSKSINPTVKSGEIAFGIRHITLNVTQICNLHCVYCIAGGDGTYGERQKRLSVENTLPQLKFLMDKLPAGEELRINFLGGEPFLYPQGIALICEWATNYAKIIGVTVRFAATTNGTLLGPEIVELLEQYSIDLAISLDGPPEVNDVVRSGRSGKPYTEQLLAGLSHFLELRRLSPRKFGRIGLSGVFGPKNLELSKAYQLYLDLDPDWFDFTFDHQKTSLDDSKKYMAEFEKVLSLAYASGGELAIRKIRPINHFFELIDSRQQVENFCGAGKSFVAIDAKNSIFSCPWLVGHADQKLGSDLELSEGALKPYQQPLASRKDCQNCWAKNLCGGGCSFIHSNGTGSVEKLDEGFCFRTRSLIALTLLYYQNCRRD